MQNLRIGAARADVSDENAATQTEPGSEIARRDFLRSAAASALVGWLPAFRVSPASAQATCAPPASFPSGIPLYQQAYENWSREIRISSLWTCAPRTAAEVLQVVNWAQQRAYKVRPRGIMHNWSPLTIEAGASCSRNVVLLDTTQSLTNVSINTSTRTVTAQTGVTMETLLAQLEGAGLGLTATPAPGDLTLGGVLAIDAHGTAVPANGETRPAGHTYGSLSNLVLSLTAAVWDAASGQYVLRTFQRSQPDCSALLAHLGRSLITEVTLQVGVNQRLRCQSYTNIPVSELFGPAGSTGRTLQSFLNSAGRLEAIWFPYTTTPWLKVWRVTPNKPLLSRQVNQPYNYPFTDSLPQQVVDLMALIVNGQPQLTTQLGPLQLSLIQTGLALTLGYDLWGWSKNLQLYIRPTTLRVHANGYAVLMRRADVQRAVNEFATFYQERLAAYQANGKYPVNGSVEIRVTGLDNPTDISSTARSPQLSAVRPRPDRSDWNVAVWFDILTVPGTQYANEFYREIEQWMFTNYSSYAQVRVEWSKGWAYTNTGIWNDEVMIGSRIPNSLRTGQPTGDNWDTARATLNRLDPFRVFSSPLLDRLLP